MLIPLVAFIMHEPSTACPYCQYENIGTSEYWLHNHSFYGVFCFDSGEDDSIIFRY
jgi:hypothetical protein